MLIGMDKVDTRLPEHIAFPRRELLTRASHSSNMPPSLVEEEEYHGDTIIVKGEYDLTRPSSPEGSMSEELLEPLVNHLLAQITPQHLESPEPLEEDILPSHLNNNSFNTARLDHPTHRAPKSRQRPNNLTMEERLQQMPEKRALPWRPGVEAGAENETGGESRRKQISCANGRGKFSVCVALEGFFKGACASCQLSGRPNRCSIKVNDDVAESSPLNTPSGGGASLNNIQPAPTPQPLSDGPKAKRRRTDTVPEWESQRPQWEQELGDSQARQQMKDIVQRPWATVNPQISTQTPPILMNGGNGTRSVPPSAIERQTPMTTPMGTPMGWATVNQPSPVPGAQMFGSGADSNGTSYQNTLEQGRREETVGNEEGSVALIDTLPKHKQRQVYGLVSGLQGGIEHLQRELDSLKKALGIDDED
ncbi:hypothetical protein G7Y89_g3047 [Cudoniella acicularis]|uniref:Uncharacterized protein n=1 Tax=Cudoniella acicularis TaxID=354080 RepID=A0A8H4RU82_9HELO|nr:hypothetical protein G7Y89_g3047 [Cudoniella acicularis]